jgi:hypothetical protein
LAGSDAAVGVGGLFDGAGAGGPLLPALQNHAALRVGSACETPVLLAVGFAGRCQGVNADLADFVESVPFQRTPPVLRFRVARRGDVDGGFERRELVGRRVRYADAIPWATCGLSHRPRQA